MTLNRRFGYIFGAVYLLVGLLGFAVTGGVGFTATDGNLLLGIFEVNPLHNIVHLAVGALLAGGAAAGAGPSRAVNMTVGVVYLAVAVLGFVVVNSAANILALNLADHLLHIVSGGLALAIAVSETRQPQAVSTDR